VGILNGIDYDQWDPARDPYLPEPYVASRLDATAAAQRMVVPAVGVMVSSLGRFVAPFYSGGEWRVMVLAGGFGRSVSLVGEWNAGSASVPVRDDVPVKMNAAPLRFGLAITL
jgi:hypothetical protein